MSSRRQYCTIADVEELADVTSTDDTEFNDQISQAEELIDAYVGYQDRHIKRTLTGLITSASGVSVYDTSDDSPLDLDDNYFTFCEIYIAGGTGAGQRRTIVASNKSEKKLTIASEFDTALDDTSFYMIGQVGKFPRIKDVHHESSNSTVYKTIPDAVRRATAAQVQFIIEMGPEFFAGEDSEMTGERLLNYSYTRGGSSNGSSDTSSRVRMVSPKARSILRGIVNRTGRLLA